MLSTRPYRDALSIEVVREELQSHAGTQFDPEIVDFFLKLSKEEIIESGPKQAS
jgi:HD-GYP domain-containing protein (c-di-GMP phosphodiesterase class II)